MPDYLVGFWNLENLFAPEGFPAREPWIAKKNAGDLKGWTQALFDRKIDQLASIIVQMGGGTGPNLLGVCAVENRLALEALSDRLVIIVTEIFSHFVMRRTGTRDTQCTFVTNSGKQTEARIANALPQTQRSPRHF